MIVFLNELDCLVCVEVGAVEDVVDYIVSRPEIVPEIVYPVMEVAGVVGLLVVGIQRTNSESYLSYRGMYLGNCVHWEPLTQPPR